MNEYQPEKIQGKNLSIFKNQDFFCFFVLTGRGVLFKDPAIPWRLLPLNASTATLGEMVISLLKSSTILSVEDAKKIFDSGDLQKNSLIWQETISAEYSYKNKGNMFTKMIRCDVKELDGEITIGPSCHDKITSWQGMADVENVIVSVNSSYEEVGLALSDAFERCRNEVR
ncbi:contact-dependent growth inhibition system immunity protein [Undibacterium sp. JH2W]|uniref:contact-dependent growth inhibition system immunity protein n=1 Tax=Undibacterium sp. JH2W TaxID=3413037 RepID=UPI003BF42E94